MGSVPATKRPRPVLSRESIAAAAMELTLEEPTTSLSLARLGAALGADPTALYRHYRNRDELLLDLADQIHGQATTRFRPRDGWAESLTDLAFSIRAEFLRRPALVAETGARFTGGPNERRTMLIVRSILEQAGLPESVLDAQTRAIGALVFSHAVMTAMLMTLPDAARETDITIARQIHGESAGPTAVDFENTSFAMILGTFLEGIAAQAKTAGGTQ